MRYIRIKADKKKNHFWEPSCKYNPREKLWFCVCAAVLIIFSENVC